MQVYVDYGFYLNEYGGRRLSVDDQRLAILNASQFIRNLTLKRSDNFEGEELKYAVCAIADIYYDVYLNNSGNNIKSENTDGYSATYVNENTDGESKEVLFSRKAYIELQKWLLTTGLLNTKVGCCHDHQH